MLLTGNILSKQVDNFLFFLGKYFKSKSTFSINLSLDKSLSTPHGNLKFQKVNLNNSHATCRFVECFKLFK